MTPNQKMREAIEDVENMSYAELRTKFYSFFGDEAVCPLNARSVKNRLIYKIQEMYLGGIDADDLHLLSDISGQKELAAKTQRFSSMSGRRSRLRKNNSRLFFVSFASFAFYSEMFFVGAA